MIPERPAATEPAATDTSRAVGIGILLMIAAMLIMPVMDAGAKLLTPRLPIWEIVWARFFAHSLWAAPLFLARHRPSDLFAGQVGLQLFRSSLIVPATALYFAAIAVMPLADALAVFFVYPCIATMLAPIVLGDRVGVWRWTATIVGFIGALVVIQPGAEVISEGALLVLAGAVFIAVYGLLTRKLAGQAPPMVTLMMTGLLGLAVTTPFAFANWVPPTAAEWGLFLVIGLSSSVGHWLMIEAYERAPVSVIAPLGYIEIVTATLLGFLLFADFPSSTTWLGIAIIVASGLIIGWRERVRARERSTPGAA